MIHGIIHKAYVEHGLLDSVVQRHTHISGRRTNLELVMLWYIYTVYVVSVFVCVSCLVQMGDEEVSLVPGSAKTNAPPTFGRLILRHSRIIDLQLVCNNFY
jgi:hypothetical protein